MNYTTTVRQITIGEGLPKLCVPLVSRGLKELEADLEALQDSPFDLVEWRADCCLSLPEQTPNMLAAIRRALPDTPVLFTVRTVKEGGMLNPAPEEYRALLCKAVDTGIPDLVDVELSAGDALVHELVEYAHEEGTAVIASSHDFQKTPEKEELIARMCRMQVLDADISKIAVMPRGPEDVLTLLDATLTMKQHYADRPLITMSMSAQGAVSRLCGAVFGSAVTFGAVGQASAPGQIEARELRRILDLLGEQQ